MSVFGMITFLFNREESYNQELRERAKRQMMAKEEEREQRIAQERRKKEYLQALYYQNMKQIPTKGFKKKSRLVGYDMWGRKVYR